MECTEDDPKKYHHSHSDYSNSPQSFRHDDYSAHQSDHNYDPHNATYDNPVDSHDDYHYE